MKHNTALIAITVAIVSGGIAFAGGMKYQEQRQASTRSFQGGQFMMRGQDGKGMQLQIRGGSGMVRPFSGEIINKDATSMTVKIEDGSTKIVLFSEKTAISKSEEGSRDDLTTGQKVGIYGQENEDGSVTAQNIQLNPVAQRSATSPSSSPEQ